MSERFFDRLRPAPKGGGFAMDDYWVWCGSAIRGPDGQYHLFASRWPRSMSFAPHWLTHSEIVRATSPLPEGPYMFQEVVLPARGERFWDGRMTHNPTIHRWGDTYLLYYTGTTYAGPTPAPERPCTPELRNEARANQRIGLATAPSPEGPWTRRDAPILAPRPEKWDGLMVTNPAPCVVPEGPDAGSVLLVYKSAADQQDLLRMGVARAAHYEGPYERLSDEPIFRFDDTGDHVEDAYVWWERTNDEEPAPTPSAARGRGRTTKGQYHLIMKDMKGGICGERGGGIHATSEDGVRWAVSRPALAYSRTVRWDDGTVTTQHRIERPQLLIEDGVPAYLFLATSDPVGSDGPRTRDQRTWTLVIPLLVEEGPPSQPVDAGPADADAGDSISSARPKAVPGSESLADARRRLWEGHRKRGGVLRWAGLGRVQPSQLA